MSEKNLTAYRLAKDTGISNSTLADWKSGKSIPKVDKLIIIADYLDVSINYLLTGKE